MSLSRRAFVQTLGAGAAGAWIGARGRESMVWSLEHRLYAAEPGVILLSSNENPMGPAPQVLTAIKGVVANGKVVGQYVTMQDVEEAVAAKLGVKRENVLLGCGSTQILRTSTHVFTSKTGALVGSIPTYEECTDYANLVGSPIKPVPMDKNLRIDLDATLAAAKGAGLIFYCNPNNPTATAMSAKDTRDFIAKVNQTSPQTAILVDEAYFEYATDPAYETMIPLALDNPRVVVARTFSKAYGMAGLRLGYAVGHRDTIKKMADWDSGGTLNVLGLHAGLAAAKIDRQWLETEKARNNEARAFTMNWFKQRGYEPTDSQTNFMFVNVKRPARGFRDACRKDGIVVARDFPPFEKTHCRISVGTLEEMKKAVAVFEKVLAAPATAAA